MSHADAVDAADAPYSADAPYAPEAASAHLAWCYTEVFLFMDLYYGGYVASDAFFPWLLSYAKLPT